jgi:hypothetical protein
MNAHVSQLNATQKSKAAIAALVSGKELLSDERARHLWLSVAGLSIAARDAEHSAFLVLAGAENKDYLAVDDFEKVLRVHLNAVREQMAFIRSLLGAAHESS